MVYGVPKAPDAVKATPAGGSAVTLEFAHDKDAVSYTHLTLPTILLV